VTSALEVFFNVIKCINLHFYLLTRVVTSPSDSHKLTGISTSRNSSNDSSSVSVATSEFTWVAVTTSFIREWSILLIYRRLDEASDHILSFLDGRDVAVPGGTTSTSTYKTLRDTFDLIIDCGYFTRPLRTDDNPSDTLTNGHGGLHHGMLAVF